MRKVKIEELSFFDCIGIIIKRLIIILFLIAAGIIIVKYISENNVEDIISDIKILFIIDLSISSVFEATVIIFSILIWISILFIIIYKIVSSIHLIYSVIFNTLIKCIDTDTGEVVYTYRSKLQSNSYYIPINKDGDDNDETTEEEQIQK